MSVFTAISRPLKRLVPQTKLARTALAVIVAATAVLGPMASLNVAQASAYGCTGYGWIKVPFTHVSSSRWCGQINGNGLAVTSVQGSFFTLIAGVYLCNTSMKAEFFDAQGRSIGTFYSAVTKGCLQAGGVFSIAAHGTMPNEGHAEMSLLSYGVTQATVSENFKYAAPAAPAKPAPTPTKVITSPAVLSPSNLKTSSVAVPTPATAVQPLAQTGYAPTATAAPVATPQPTPAPTSAASVWYETAGGAAHTWANYSNAGGYEGATIGGGQTVAVSCKLVGFRVADGNTWWYRVASSPWNNAYYVSADAFYNNGATGGSLHGTPWVDANVPNC